MTRETREMKEIIQETKETTRDEGGGEDNENMMETMKDDTMGTTKDDRGRRGR